METHVETEGFSPGARRSRPVLLRAALAAGVAMALTRAAGPAGPAAASKRTKRLKTKRCKKQVQECIDSLTAACNGEPACLENLVCCDLFADCNAAAAVPCIFANAN
ncbi:MAG: hypothetical protein KC442_16285 [Thermomicrobiales bacterium]|nr:hypothetical protein [Thermomicrobiales bacterium]